MKKLSEKKITFFKITILYCSNFKETGLTSNQKTTRNKHKWMNCLFLPLSPSKHIYMKKILFLISLYTHTFLQIITYRILLIDIKSNLTLNSKQLLSRTFSLSFLNISCVHFLSDYFGIKLFHIYNFSGIVGN